LLKIVAKIKLFAEIHKFLLLKFAEIHKFLLLKFAEIHKFIERTPLLPAITQFFPTYG